MKTNEVQFYEVLENLFIGVKIEDQQESLLDPTPKAVKNGMLNLIKAKSKYYQSKKQELEKLIDCKCQNNNDLKEELFDKLYSFFKRYFSANGGIYFNDTPLYDSLYTKSDYEKCSLKKDTALFYKTKDLYYVKSETNYKDFCFELENILFNFDASSLESKKNNEKIDLVFDLKDIDTKTNTLNFSVTLSSKGTQTKISEILKDCFNQGVKLDEEILKKAFVKFKKQGSMDYFIHKNALGFLKEQLDLYLFEYLFKEMTAFDAKRLNEINTIKEVALQVIVLVSEFENELCKIWNKPRFVLNSHFIVSLDKLKAKNYDLNKITTHTNYPKQVKEWQDLNLKTTDNLLENEFLPLDTLYFKDLEEEIKNLFSEDEINGTLIKSENYQALNSLKNRYKEKIDCIYIDPPYNTQNNEFIYADNFKRSSWLSMMENRLELAHSLLNDKGVMFVSIDDNEQAYLKTLMDEVFNWGGDNFVNCLSVKLKNIAGASGGGEDKRIKKNIEYVLIYAKNYEILNVFNPVYDSRELYSHISFCNENNISWKYNSILIDKGDKKLLGVTYDGNGDGIKIYERSNYIIKSIKQVAQDENLTEKEIYYKYINLIFRTTMPQSSIRVRVLEKLKELKLNPYLISIEYTPKSGKNKGIVYEQFYNGDKLNLFA